MNTDEQIIKVRVTNLNAQHYADLGYDFELNDFIFVPAKDLTHGSGIKVCRIICTSDKVPDDNTLLSIKQDIIQKLYYDGYNEYVINLDDNTKSTR